MGAGQDVKLRPPTSEASSVGIRHAPRFTHTHQPSFHPSLLTLHSQQELLKRSKPPTYTRPSSILRHSTNIYIPARCKQMTQTCKPKNSTVRPRPPKVKRAPSRLWSDLFPTQTVRHCMTQSVLYASLLSPPLVRS